MFLYAQFYILCCGNAVLMVWFGLGTKKQSGCLRGRAEKTKKGHQLCAVGHQRTEGHLLCNAFIVNWKSTLEGTLSRFIYHRGI